MKRYIKNMVCSRCKMVTKLVGGSQFTLYSAHSKLNSLYGKNPMAFEVYLRFYPALMKM